MDTLYIEAIETASKILSEVLLNQPDELINSGANLDGLVKNTLRDVGNIVLTQLYQALSKKLVSDYKAKGYHIEQNKTVQFKTLYGEVKVASPYLRHPNEPQGVRPMKTMMGVVGNNYSEAVERALVDFGSEKSFHRAVKQFKEHYGFEVGVNIVGRHTQSTAREAEDYLEKRLSENVEKKKTRVKEMLTELDGCEIRTGEYKKVASNDEERLIREESWREVRTGFVRPIDEVERTYICQIGSYPEVCDQLEKAATLRGLDKKTQVIAPGDGGHGLMEEMGVHFRNFQYILDHRHLASHFYDTAKALGIAEASQKGWVSDYFEKLWENKVTEVLNKLEALNKEKNNDRLRQLIGYLTRFKACVDYGKYKDNDWPVGSGEVESAHRYLPQERLKIAGACWKVESVNPMLALRVIKANGWWDDFWEWLHNERKLKRAA